MPTLAMMLASVCWLSVATVNAAEPAKPDPLPAAVAADLESVAGTCREVGGAPRTADAVTRVDLNADGNQDFILNVGAINCDGAASVYGDREKSVTVYAGDGKGGATAAFTDAAFGAKVDGTGAGAKLWLTVSGAQCGKKPAQDFASEAFCERPLVWNASAKKLEYAPVTAVRMIE